jgi:hypothetical protein
MNREELIRMARESGAAPYTNRHYPDRTTHTFSPNQLERFAALVAAAEREACAKICDDRAFQFFTESPFFVEMHELADKIRARGKA